MHRWRHMLLMLFMGLLGGCAGPGSIVPQQSTLSDVRAAMGSPTDIRRAPNGDELWEYARGPAGTETYLIRAGTDGRVKAVTQLLTQARFAKIVPNQTTRAEVRELLGRPSEELSLRGGTTWTWRVHVGPQDGHFVVRFRPNGIVRDTALQVEMSRDSGDGGGLLGNPIMR